MVSRGLAGLAFVNCVCVLDTKPPSFENNLVQRPKCDKLAWPNCFVWLTASNGIPYCRVTFLCVTNNGDMDEEWGCL